MFNSALSSLQDVWSMEQAAMQSFLEVLGELGSKGVVAHTLSFQGLLSFKRLYVKDVGKTPRTHWWFKNALRHRYKYKVLCNKWFEVESLNLISFLECEKMKLA